MHHGHLEKVRSTAQNQAIGRGSCTITYVLVNHAESTHGTPPKALYLGVEVKVEVKVKVKVKVCGGAGEGL